MSFKYYTKTIKELQQISKVISDNLSVLVGCSYDSKLWCPPVAYEACKSIFMAGSSCSNISDKYEESEVLSFKFTSVANSSMKDIWNKVINFDSSIYDLNKLSTIKVNANLDIESKLKICINQSTEYNSSIFGAVVSSNELKYSEDYTRIMWILLAGFCLRYQIYDFSIGKTDFIDLEILSDYFINTVVENIKYEKYKLSQYDKKDVEFDSSTDYISQQLSILMKNCKQLHSYVIAYLK